LYLKNITLRGFKSFGNRSSLNFQQGISVVVGPNGSGKSNIADGISWVLGEQSPKSLRGNSMGDVIFRSKKQEMGIAEVSLLFNNKDKLFDVEFSEVRITRRVLAEGGSEYFINSSPCRLMDIQEMIADSGIGKGLHIIINQGQVNRVALLKPVERKLIIDEALGLSKHKNRRNKSISKLEKVKDDVGRLDDLMEEIRRTMDPLEIEAKRAREYAVISNELKNEEMSLFLSNLSRLNVSWEKLEKDHKKTKENIRETNDRTLEVEREKGELIKNIGSKQVEYENWRAKIESFDSGTSRLSNNFALIESKKNVFSTLYNMFDLEISNEDVPRQAAEEIAEKKVKEILGLSFLGKITKKIEMIDVQFRIFIEKVNNAVKGTSMSRDIENEGDIISKELGSILKEMHEGNTVRQSKRLKEAAAESKKLFEEEKKRSEIRLKRIKDLRELCRINLERAEGVINILERCAVVSEKIKKRLYPEFERQKRLISGDQQKTEGYNSKIGDLKIKENTLENDIYKINLRREQVRDRVKSITTAIVDDYNMSIEYASKNFKPSEDLQQSEIKVRRLKNKMRNFGSVNPNAAIEFAKIKKRYGFLDTQRQDLIDSKKQLIDLIKEINEKISSIFLEKFEEINSSFQQYFKILFPRGEGEMILDRSENETIG